MRAIVISYVAIILLADEACTTQTATEKILFIGNSHTYYNNMPKLVEKIAAANGRKLQCDMIVQDGFTLSDHAAMPATTRQIRKGGYAKVVLQENSLALFFWSDSLRGNGLKELAAAIKDANANGYILQNWANQYADSLPLARFGKGFYYDHFKSYEEAQQILINKSENIATKFELQLIPAGKLWRAIFEKHPSVDLWLDEWGHPDKTGSIIVAAMIYSRIFGEMAKLDKLLEGQNELSNDIGFFIKQIISQ